MSPIDLAKDLSSYRSTLLYHDMVQREINRNSNLVVYIDCANHICTYRVDVYTFFCKVRTRFNSSGRSNRFFFIGRNTLRNPF